MGVKAGQLSERKNTPECATRYGERMRLNGRQQQEDGVTGVMTVP
jgi:hypothetical protein